MSRIVHAALVTVGLLGALAGAPAPAPAHEVAPVVATIAGKASWYGPKFHGRTTASGEPFDMDRLTAAHRTLPFGTLVRVVNPASGAAVVVRINDRGPFAGKRVIDLSRRAAQAIGIVERGVARVRIEVLAQS